MPRPRQPFPLESLLQTGKMQCTALSLYKMYPISSPSKCAANMLVLSIPNSQAATNPDTDRRSTPKDPSKEMESAGQ